MLGPQCCSNPPTLNPASGGGHLEELAGFNTYVTGSLDSKLAVLLASDAFGSLRTRFSVVLDLLYGDPFAPKKSDRPIGVWLKGHCPEKGLEDAKLVIDAMKSKGVSAIGAAGSCWGAKVVVGLAKEALIQAAVVLHPSLVTVDDIKGVRVPISILAAEFDRISPPQLVKQFDEILSDKPEVDKLVKIFPKCAHGWTVRYNPENATSVSRADEAYQDLLAWFSRFLPRSTQHGSRL